MRTGEAQDIRQPRKMGLSQLCPSLSVRTWPGPFTPVGLGVPLPERWGVELHDPQEPFQPHLPWIKGCDIMFQNIDNMHIDKVDRETKAD